MNAVVEHERTVCFGDCIQVKDGETVSLRDLFYGFVASLDALVSLAVGKTGGQDGNDDTFAPFCFHDPS